MAFTFGAGDPRRPSSSSDVPPVDGYFAAQAMRAGYFNSEPRARLDLVAPPPAPVSAREALQRELQKDRIREEILAREHEHQRRALQHRTMLEDAVRRRGMEAARRHEAAMRSPGPMYHHPPPPRFDPFPEFRAPSPLGLPDLDPRRALPVTHRPEVRIAERLGMARRPMPVNGKKRIVPRSANPGGIREKPFVPHGPKPVIKKKLPAGRREYVNEGKQPRILSGTKRKSVTTGSADELPYPSKKWSCSLCEVTTTSQQGLKDHLEGKKHKAKVEETEVNKTSLPADKAKEAEKPLPADKAKEAEKPLPADKAKKAEKPLPADRSKEVSKPSPAKVVAAKGLGKKQPFYCDVCKVNCNSQSMLDSHLNGKKHKAQLEELNKPITAEEPEKDEPVTAEQSGKDDRPVTIEDSRKEDKPVTVGESGKASTAVTVTKHVTKVVKKVKKQTGAGKNPKKAVEETVKEQLDTQVSTEAVPTETLEVAE